MSAPRPARSYRSPKCVAAVVWLVLGLLGCRSDGPKDAEPSAASRSAERAVPSEGQEPLDRRETASPERSAPSAFGAKPLRVLPAEQWRAPSGYELRARYMVYAGLTEAIDDQEAGSVDAMVVTLSDVETEVMLVEVRIDPRSATELPALFVTTVRSSNGAPSEKTWAPAEGNRGAGVYRALVSVPNGATSASTRPAPTQAAG